jgi:hypothetical protein
MVNSLNIANLCVWISSTSCMYHFSFFIIFGRFLPDFSSASLEEFFFDSFPGFVCLDEPHHLPPTLEWIHGSSPFDFMDFSSFPQNLSFWVHLKSEGKSFNLKNPLLGTCSLYWGDPCVQVSFDLEHYSSRIKLGKKGVDFERKSRTPTGQPTGQCPMWPEQGLNLSFEFQRLPIVQYPALPNSVRSYRTIYGCIGQCPTDSFSLTFIHYFGYILLTGCPIDPILFPLHS